MSGKIVNKQTFTNSNSTKQESNRQEKMTRYQILVQNQTTEKNKYMIIIKSKQKNRGNQDMHIYIYNIT